MFTLNFNTVCMYHTTIHVYCIEYPVLQDHRKMTFEMLCCVLQCHSWPWQDCQASHKYNLCCMLGMWLKKCAAIAS